MYSFTNDFFNLLFLMILFHYVFPFGISSAICPVGEALPAPGFVQDGHLDGLNSVYTLGLAHNLLNQVPNQWASGRGQNHSHVHRSVVDDDFLDQPQINDVDPNLWVNYLC